MLRLKIKERKLKNNFMKSYRELRLEYQNMT
jgi:hypothetical protein